MELIRIFDNNGGSAVSARELYLFLGYDSSQWKRWYTKNILNNEFAIENEDYEVFDIMSNTDKGGRPTKDFALAIDFAKKISMMSKTEKGEEARKYFLDCEKKAKQKPLSQLEILAQSAQILLEQDKKLTEISNKQDAMEDKMKILEAKTQTRPDFYTIAGFGTIHGTMVNVTMAAQLGRKASKLCKERDIETDKIKDPRFGFVKLYPENILKEVFEQTYINR